MAAVTTMTGSLAYLEKRTEQMRYAQFAEAGYPHWQWDGRER